MKNSGTVRFVSIDHPIVNPFARFCPLRRAGMLLLALTSAACLLALPVSSLRAANLLVNPGFESAGGHFSPPASPAPGWTRFAPPTAQSFGNYWVLGNEAPPHTGLLCYKQWGASYDPANNSVAGIYQDFGAAPGSIYQASGWLFTRSTDVLGPDCYLWLEVLFFDSTANLLALYKSSPFSASVGTGAWFQYQVTNKCDISSPVS